MVFIFQLLLLLQVISYSTFNSLNIYSCTVIFFLPLFRLLSLSLSLSSQATASHRNLGSNDNFQSVSLLWTAPNLTDPSVNVVINPLNPDTGAVNIS